MACHTLTEFQKIHDPQIKGISLPKHLVSDLFSQLNEGVNKKKIKEYFSIKKVKNCRPTLIARKPFKKNELLFVIDHIWTSDGNMKCSELLRKSPDLSERLTTLFNLPELTVNCANFNDQIQIVKRFTNCSIEEATSAVERHDGCTTTALVSLLDDEKQQDSNTTTREEKPDISFEEFVASLQMNDDIPDNASEQYLRKMYEGFCNDKQGSGTTSQYNWEDEGDSVTVYVPIPYNAHKNAIKSTLKTKSWLLCVEKKEVLNGELNSSVKVDDSYWSIESPGILCMTLEKVSSDVWSVLLKGEEKLSATSIVQKNWAKKKYERLYYNDILDTMWRFNQTYSVVHAEKKSKSPQWYLMDEIGSAMTHSDDPNMKCSPFFYSVLGRAYSVVWPIKDIEVGQACTRNFIPQIHPNETFDMCKIRLKAYFVDVINENNIMKNSEDLQEIDVEEDFSQIKFTHLSNKIYRPENPTKVALGRLANRVTPQDLVDFHISVADSSDAVKVIALKATNIKIAGNELPSSETFQNKDYMQSYLKSRFGHVSWFAFSHILPADLKSFYAEFESTHVTQYWVVKSVDKRVTSFEPFVSSQFARIVRFCETGSISVVKYFDDHLMYKKRTTALSFPVIISPTTNDVFIYTQPLLRRSKVSVNENEMLDEYDDSANLSQSPSDEENQTSDLIDDFKVAMNKLLLPRNPDQGWQYVESCIYQVLGRLGKGLSEDLVVGESETPQHIIFNVDVMVTCDLRVHVIDIFPDCISPNQKFVGDLLRLILAGESECFVRV